MTEKWHTGTPTETGEYLVCIRYDMGEMGYTTANYVEPYNPHNGWYNLKPPSEISADEWCKKNGIEVIAWQKIEPYEASKVDSVESLPQEEEPKHKGTFDDPLPQPKYEPPKIMLV